MKKALFIDRDGTLIVEPPVDRQVDSLEKLRFVPGAISGLRALSGLDFELVLATNQDGLGTPSFPEATFRPAHERMLATLEGEGVPLRRPAHRPHLRSRRRPHAQTPHGDVRPLSRRKLRPRGQLRRRRPADRHAAGTQSPGRGASCSPPDEEAGRRALREAGAEAACALVAPSWERIAEFIRRGERSVTLTRRTAETQITLTLDLDGRSGAGRIATGIGFFDHMLAQIAHHGGVSLSVEATGDLWVDEHHTSRMSASCSARRSTVRWAARRESPAMASSLPMDDCRAMALASTSGAASASNGRPNSAANASVNVPTEMLRHFFHSFACAARCNLHVAARGDNEHHKAEAIFKAFARALRMAVARIPFAYDIPSSKGVL